MKLKNSRGKKRTLLKERSKGRSRCFCLVHASILHSTVKTTPSNTCCRHKTQVLCFCGWLEWAAFTGKWCTHKRVLNRAHLLTNPTASQSVERLVDKINLTNQYITRVFTYIQQYFNKNILWIRVGANVCEHTLWSFIFMLFMHVPWACCCVYALLWMRAGAIEAVL